MLSGWLYAAHTPLRSSQSMTAFEAVCPIISDDFICGAVWGQLSCFLMSLLALDFACNRWGALICCSWVQWTNMCTTVPHFRCNEKVTSLNKCNNSTHPEQIISCMSITENSNCCPLVIWTSHGSLRSQFPDVGVLFSRRRAIFAKFFNQEI